VAEQAPQRAVHQRCCLLPSDLRLGPEAAAVFAQDFRLLADPIRLQILDLLAERGGEVCVCDLEAALPVKQPTVSHHLRLLHQAGAVSVVRRGLWAYYRLVPSDIQLRRNRLEAFLQSLSTDSRAQPMEVSLALPIA
jgi:ArsR family transcriptional regulator